MKNQKWSYILILVLCFSFCCPTFASTKTVGRVASTTGLRMRSGPGTNYEKIVTVPHNAKVTILSYSDKTEGCGKSWAEVLYEGSTSTMKGYVCSLYLEDIEEIKEEEKKDDSSPEDKNDDKENEKTEDPQTPVEPTKPETSSQGMAKMTEEEFDAYLNSQGFPESYKTKLKALHKLHPNWIFKGVKSKYTWAGAMQEETVSGRSLYNVNASLKASGYEGYLSVAPGDYNYETDTFLPHDGVYWYQANNQTIAYYMDPRNFLTENGIFMFEDLLYNPSYQNAELVSRILSSSFMQQFTEYFMEAAKTYNVSPMYLAALSRQEVGISDTNIVTNGKAGVLSDGVNYNGYYNFYNYGASSSGDPKLKSLQAAKLYNWNSQRKSIVEGANWITVNYVQCGQYTPYFQKFNLSPTTTKGIWHQWATNIIASVSPASTTYKSYKDMGIIEEEFSFSIPIFDGMPDSTSLPNLGNPNNWLQELKINGQLVTNFSGGKTDYTVNIPYAESIEISAKTVNSNASVAGTGVKQLNSDNTTFQIVVTAQNKETKTYTVHIVREKKPVVEEPKPSEKEENHETEQKPSEIPEQKPTTPSNPTPEVPKTTVADVLKASGYKYDNQYIWNISLTTNVDGIIQQLTKTYKTASVNIRTRNNETKNEGTIVTGDKIILSIDGDTKTLEVVIYGDLNGDGMISAVDLLNIQKHILGYTTLLGSYAKAADVNKDGKVSAVDLLDIQKQILNYTNISQG